MRAAAPCRERSLARHGSVRRPRVCDKPTQVDDRDDGLHRSKDFLYVRYNADLTDAGLAELGLGDHGIDPDQVRQMDAVDDLEDLRRIGAVLGRRVDLAHLGSFVGE